MFLGLRIFGGYKRSSALTDCVWQIARIMIVHKYPSVSAHLPGCASHGKDHVISRSCRGSKVFTAHDVNTRPRQDHVQLADQVSFSALEEIIYMACS